MKAPAFQFYVGDYMQDTRMISLAARGAWMDLLCKMWAAQIRGQVTSSVVGYARLFGCTVEQAQAVIDELLDSEVCDTVTERDGKVTLKNRRMFREAREREGANLRQEKYRERRKRQSDEGGDAKRDAEVTPPSSTSSPPTTTKKELNYIADAHAPPKPKPKRESVADPRTNHPAIELVRKLMCRRPHLILYDEIIEIFGDSPDIDRAATCRKAWVSRGSNTNSTDWIYWYRDGVPLKGNQRNGNQKPSIADRAREHNDFYAVGQADSSGKNSLQ